MAMSVKRRIERNLPAVMGQRDPEAMIRVRSTDPIRASGLVPRQQAGHMTASDYTRQNAIKPLPAGGHPHMTELESQLSRRLVLVAREEVTVLDAARGPASTPARGGRGSRNFRFPPPEGFLSVGGGLFRCTCRHDGRRCGSGGGAVRRWVLVDRAGHRDE